MDSHLTQAQLNELRAALEAKRDALQRALATHGRRIEDDDREIEELDAAERDIALTDDVAVGEHAHRQLEAVEEALAAMQEGSYGRSVVSGDPIPFERLKAVPWARTNADE
jgi:DnaK suppressor protein